MRPRREALAQGEHAQLDDEQVKREFTNGGVLQGLERANTATTNLPHTPKKCGSSPM